MQSQMIRDVTLSDGLVTTSFGIGCAALFGEPSPRRRRAVMEAALGSGVRHFDVAPMYGLGLAERELGRFARGRRESIVIATKFGIRTTAAAAALARIQRPVRGVMRRVPVLQQKMRERALGPGAELGDVLYRKPGYGAAALQRSLETSLKHLGTDYVDLLLLHDPVLSEVPVEETAAAVERSVRSGQVRSWGVAGERKPTVAVAGAFGRRVPVLQVSGDFANPDSFHIRAVPADGLIVFGILGRVLQAIAAAWRDDAALQGRWQAELGIDCGRSNELAHLLLLDAAHRYRQGTILLGTTRPSRFAELAVLDEEEVSAQAGTIARLRALYRELPGARVETP
jgi:D-threo-aldose 1-dehydrogenase